MEDILLQRFFEKQRWTDAIQTGIDKEMNLSLLKELSSPYSRVALYHQILDDKYIIRPPHEARIPKDDGTFRTVYVNEGTDRIILSIINDMLFEMCPEMIHPHCKSYQKGIGCGKIVQSISHIIPSIDMQKFGVKVDLSKYFDSVPIKYIDSVFDCIETKYGQSKILNIVRQYYHTDTVLDINKNIIHKYSSLRQGCAVAAFLADAVLYDIDAAVSDIPDMYYVRYSDDILIIGENWEKGYELLKKMLSEKSLILNPKKVEILDKNYWFKFLGFNIKNDKITLSASRIKSFQHEIELRTIRAHDKNLNQILHNVQQYLYKGNGAYSWSTGVLPIINVAKDIQTLNAFVMDAIRACATDKTKIGGLGFSSNTPDYSIIRGTGKNVKSNKQKLPKIANYMTISCMQNAMLTARPVYDTLTRTM